MFSVAVIILILLLKTDEKLYEIYIPDAGKGCAVCGEIRN